MGRESSEWYNTQILVGFTDQRGKAWHYREDKQGAEPNHYPQAIPVDDVRRRLFSWQAVKKAVYITSDTGFAQIPNRSAVVRNDNNTVFGVFSDSYQVHQYDEWLLQNLANIIDDDIAIGSAGLLKQGGVAWVSLEMPENITALEGFDIRPHLLATTSHNGSMASTYKQVTTFVVCDNTYTEAMNEEGQSYSVRHTKYSAMRIGTARDALQIVHKMTDEMVSHIRTLSNIKVTDEWFNSLVKTMMPKPKDGKTSAALTRWDDRVMTISNLYRNDERVAPWRGTGLGVIQAFNTYNQHLAGNDKMRLERNMLNTLNGTTHAQDSKILRLLGVK